MSARAPAPEFDPALTARIGYDGAALENFYLAHYETLLRYFTRRVGEPQDVADLIADTFLAAMGSASSFDPGRGRPVSWLLGIAHNLLRGFHRQRGNDRRILSRAGGRRLLDSDDIEQLAARIDAEAEGARAVGLLSGLSPGQRELVELVDLLGLTPAEAAAVTGVRAGLVHVRLHRGRAALRAALEAAPTTPSEPAAPGFPARPIPFPDTRNAR